MTAYIKRKAGLPSDGDGASETLRSCIQQNTKGGPNHSRLRGKGDVQSQHIAEAVGYRNLDRGDWAERGI